MIARRQSGFALVITLALLALLVLALYALSALAKVGSDVAATSAYRVLARQNAQLALTTALGELQRYAGDDDMLTGMAGITGVPAGAGNPARHWCGVWDGNGAFFHWLASGENGPLLPNLAGADTVALLAGGSLGADGPDKEHVRARLVPIRILTAGGVPFHAGSYAWWVGDEGVKLSAVVPDNEAPVAGGKHAIDRLITALSPTNPSLVRAETYAQLLYVPSTPLSTGQLQANLHAMGRTHYGWAGPVRLAGRLNVNSTSANYWKGVAATYNRLRGQATLNETAFANTLTASFLAADPGAGKAAGGPFPAVDLFLGSHALTAALAAAGGSLLDFGDVMRPWLTVRSDTFRIRAYGDARNRADENHIEAAAWCEAIVQRVKDNPAGTAGRFVITYFRWLGPDEI